MSTSPGEPESSREALGSDDAVDDESEMLWGTPTSIVSWITFPAFIVIFGILGEIFLLRTVRSEFGFLVWAQLAAGAVIVIVGVALAWAGCLAYSRITVTDTMRFHRATAVGVAILSTVLVVSGIFGGSSLQVLAGVSALVGLWIWAIRFPSKPIAFRLLRLLLYRMVFVVAAELLASVVVSAVMALVDGDLPTTLASNYLGAGIVYCVVAITGCVVTARKLSGASREDAAR